MANPIASPKLNVLVFAASLRTQSLNRKLATLAARTAEQYGATVDVASMRDFDVPLYDGDVEVANGIPKGAQDFRSRLQATDAPLPLLRPHSHGVARVDGKRASINGARPKTGPEDLCSARKVSTPDWAPFGSAQIQIGGAMDESSPIPNPRFFSRLRRRHVVASLRTAE